MRDLIVAVIADGFNIEFFADEDWSYVFLSKEYQGVEYEAMQVLLDDSLYGMQKTVAETATNVNNQIRNRDQPFQPFSSN